MADGPLEMSVNYKLTPTIKLFHESKAQFRCIVGPVGSGKTSAAAIEVGHLKPFLLAKYHGIKHTKWVVLRNTYNELTDTTLKTVKDWFPFGRYVQKSKDHDKTMFIEYPKEGITSELLFRSCDNPDDIKKFKSLEITGYWIDESIEVDNKIKLMLKTRIGRYPKKCPAIFGIETTNPPDVEHTTYSQFKWNRPPPGPKPSGTPLEQHFGFWQVPYENEENLRPGYYSDLRKMYADNPDWVEMYIEGKPGVLVQGKKVYNNYSRKYHESKIPLVWKKGRLFRGWDNSGNCPACVVLQMPQIGNIEVLREFTTDKEGIVDFTRRAVISCNELYPDAEYVDFCDPAGYNKYSTKEGGFTSNAELQQDECGIEMNPSEQNLTARIESVEQLLLRINGLLLDPSCTRLINGFIGGYCKKEIGGRGSNIYNPTPLKNRFSHPHDALQYIVLKITQSVAKYNYDDDDDDDYSQRETQIVGRSLYTGY